MHSLRALPRLRRAALLPQAVLFRIRQAAGRSTQDLDPCPPLRARPRGELLCTPRAPLRPGMASSAPAAGCLDLHPAGSIQSTQEWAPSLLLLAWPGGELLYSPQAPLHLRGTALLPPAVLISIKRAAGWSTREWDPRPSLRARPRGELLSCCSILSEPRSAYGEQLSCRRLSQSTTGGPLACPHERGTLTRHSRHGPDASCFALPEPSSAYGERRSCRRRPCSASCRPRAGPLESGTLARRSGRGQEASCVVLPEPSPAYGKQSSACHRLTAAGCHDLHPAGRGQVHSSLGCVGPLPAAPGTARR